ncbi:YebC/PmpR family DNA-binding transcriptional regulator [Sulfobacillus thermosulfidooxidans]|uniref:Probable transcriptional regulatory protein SAMN00768000_0024 n=2 Tax=Sulfobacillus thermosulfidooxidans TaxID=28034 RepID=A0A1W1W5Z2_SULTA|nr:YebC/PmpR family DNA-binding transcriptional regulator [Sulfobacillus thermosulfidooxidans]OLZ09820.1 transcriptional regulator [Sulfobacillus thermosulfidooxidans]OLZ15874.1 transcriptional regulator [Sulfobacillus thermosulfidooxidans]OLZ18279.1 transcriptional regulator [Sulfobacillus thermosulfidooxidans]PSR25652.1 MAG: YebC/PmpR family DNA-binding transcriptional regulator [Sulfobacillus thermosulfidooxidans]SMC01612.1 DNA-binding regulatory protein, YebC/PmpR family [Sulfobacillus the
MSGHSKWANIKRKKAKVDAVKGTVFSRLTKEIMAAAKRGGGNPETNFRLRLAIQKAKANNLPQANIDRAIRRATGQEEGVHYEETVYEGYGPGGVAVYLQILTDNRNRTAGEIRHIFSRHGGALGESGCVAWMFEPKGRLVITDTDKSEEELLDLAIEAGADDLRREDDEFVVLTAPDALDQVREAFESQHVKVSEAELVQLPKTTTEVSGSDATQLATLIELLEDHDDVEKVFFNGEFPDDFELDEA